MISIIIPVLNEAKNINQLLQHLTEKSAKICPLEIIIVDGGSTDGTDKTVEKFLSRNKNIISTNKFKIVFINSSKGRAKQMNVGAKASTGTILYFLHADSFPPKDFDQFILDKIQKGHEAGCFRMQFDSNHWWLQMASWFTQFNHRACRGGDQSLYITKELFHNIGGYNENYIIYEDNILIGELYKRNQFTVINKKITTSARLYHEIGIWKLQYLYFRVYFKKWLGASADDLYAYYRKNIS